MSPDPHNPLNDVSTMNKVLEYMAVGLPIVSFELHEARVSAGDAARYVRCNDTQAFAGAVSALLDDPIERRRRGRVGQERVAGSLSWDHSKRQLIASYAAAMGVSPEPSMVDGRVDELHARPHATAELRPGYGYKGEPSRPSRLSA